MEIKSFKLKLILSYVLIIFFSLGLVAFFLNKNLQDNSLRNIKASLINQAYLIQSQISVNNIKQEQVGYLDPLVTSLSKKVKCRITVITNKGKVLADSEKPEEEILQMENHLYRPEIQKALEQAVGIDTRYSSTLKIYMLYVALPIKENNQVIGVLRLALPLSDVKEALSQSRRIVLFGLFFALAFAFILGSIIAAQTTQPINRMIQASLKFSQGDFSRRIIQPAKDEIGQLASTLNKMAQDLEDKIKQIKAQNQKLAAIFNSMIEGVIVIDQNYRIISVNPTIEQIFSISKEGVKGKVFLEAIRNNDISAVIEDVLRSGKPLSSEISLVLPVRKTFEVNAAPIFDNQTVTGCLVVMHDITEIRRLETIRSDFVANVSHELKTPLTSIKGFTETLLEGALNDKENSRNFLKIIQAHAQRLNDLIEDLLSLSHLESKEIILNKQKLNLKQQLEEVTLIFISQLKKMNIKFKNELPEDTLINADKNMLQQVLTNLVDNAIKFNKKDGLIRVYTQKNEAGIKVYIEDSGLGIPSRDIERIFERFYRVDKARSRQLGGTGLGLSIVKHIIQLHQGSLGVESVEGLGSKFWFILPE